MFEKARLKLTFWYTISILLITGTLSLLFYNRISFVLDKEFARIEDRLQREELRILKQVHVPHPRIQPEDLNQTKRMIATQLLLVNSVIGLIALSAAYLLAGKTLKPIEKSMQKQKQFVTDAAHELRTPLTALKSSLEVSLMQKGKDKKIKQIFTENLESVEHLILLTERLLFLTKPNAGSLIKEETSINDLVNKAVDALKPLASKKKISLRKKLSKNAIKINADKTMILELFMILLDNAIKYSPEKSTVLISLTQNKNKSLVAITDQGPGINNEEVRKVFDRFYRAEKSRSKNGFGLGLSIAKKIVTAHNGKITVSSNPGKGSTFTVELPKS